VAVDDVEINGPGWLAALDQAYASLDGVIRRIVREELAGRTLEAIKVLGPVAEGSVIVLPDDIESNMDETMALLIDKIGHKRFVVLLIGRRGSVPALFGPEDLKEAIRAVARAGE